MAIYPGTVEAGALFYGSTAIARVYHGEDLVFDADEGGGGPGESGVSSVPVRFMWNQGNTTGVSTLPMGGSTPGNIIVAVEITSVSGGNASPANTGWTQIAALGDGTTAGGHAMRWVYREIQVGDGNNVQPFQANTAQRYIAAWELEKLDPEADWASIFVDVHFNLGNGTQKNADYTGLTEGDFLVLFGMTLRGSDSPSPTATDWLINTDAVIVPLNRRAVFGRKVFEGTDNIDMDTLVANPSISAGVTSLVLSASIPPPPPDVVTDYLQTVSTGNRSGIITLTNNGIEGFGSPAVLLNGNMADSSYFWYNRDSGENFVFDFGTPWVIDEFTWYQHDGTTHGTWEVAGSNDGSTWTTLSSPFTLGPGAHAWTNETAYRYYRLAHVGGNRSSNSQIREIQFKAGQP